MMEFINDGRTFATMMGILSLSVVAYLMLFTGTGGGLMDLLLGDKIAARNKRKDAEIMAELVKFRDESIEAHKQHIAAQENVIPLRKEAA